jgi:hypothetical protein
MVGKSGRGVRVWTGNCALVSNWKKKCSAKVEHPLNKPATLPGAGISSCTTIQRKVVAEDPAGGQHCADKVLQEQHRNRRVWLQERPADLESDLYGSWPINNGRLANALKLKNYN